MNLLFHSAVFYVSQLPTTGTFVRLCITVCFDFKDKCLNIIRSLTRTAFLSIILKCHIFSSAVEKL